MADFCGISCSSCWTTTSSATATTLHGSVATPASLKSSIQQAWRNSGVSRKITCLWTTTRCHVPCVTTTVSTSWGRFRVKDTVTSKLISLNLKYNKFDYGFWMSNLMNFLLFRFLRNPSELKSIKNISLLRQSMVNQQQNASSQSNQTSSNTAAALQASALASLLPQSTNLHQLTAALAQNKMDYKNKHDDEPTDLSTSNVSSERSYIKTEAVDCYP